MKTKIYYGSSLVHDGNKWINDGFKTIKMMESTADTSFTEFVDDNATKKENPPLLLHKMDGSTWYEAISPSVTKTYSYSFDNISPTAVSVNGVTGSPSVTVDAGLEHINATVTSNINGTVTVVANSSYMGTDTSQIDLIFSDATHDLTDNFLLKIYSVCFAAGTKIRMSDGSLKNIEDIHVGDSVMSYNTTDDNTASSKVTYTKVQNAVSDVVTVYLANGSNISLTASHCIYTTDGWKCHTPTESSYSKLAYKVGDNVYLYDGTASEIISISANNEIQPVYHITLETNDALFAGSNADIIAEHYRIESQVSVRPDPEPELRPYPYQPDLEGYQIIE